MGTSRYFFIMRLTVAASSARRNERSRTPRSTSETTASCAPDARRCARTQASAMTASQVRNGGLTRAHSFRAHWWCPSRECRNAISGPVSSMTCGLTGRSRATIPDSPTGLQARERLRRDRSSETARKSPHRPVRHATRGIIKWPPTGSTTRLPGPPACFARPAAGCRGHCRTESPRRSRRRTVQRGAPCPGPPIDRGCSSP